MKLQQFPPSRINGAYALGANKRNLFAAPLSIKTFEYCCYYVFSKFGALPYPIVVWDCSTAKGTTPGYWRCYDVKEKKYVRKPVNASTNSSRFKNCRWRYTHPRNAHNDGRNIDIGYYGLDRAVKLKNGKKLLYAFVPGRHNSVRMTGRVDEKLLAVEAEVAWFMALARTEMQSRTKIINTCVVDPYINRLLEPKFSKVRLDSSWSNYKHKIPGEAKRICGKQWPKHHHHHRHLRLYRRKDADRLAEGIEEALIQPLLQSLNIHSTISQSLVKFSRTIDVGVLPTDDEPDGPTPVYGEDFGERAVKIVE